MLYSCIFFFQAEDGIRDKLVTGVQTCALPISRHWNRPEHSLQVEDDGRAVRRDGGGEIGAAVDLDQPWRRRRSGPRPAHEERDAEDQYGNALPAPAARGVHEVFPFEWKGNFPGALPPGRALLDEGVWVIKTRRVPVLARAL